MDQPDDYFNDYPPTAHPWREAATMTIVALLFAALLVWIGETIWRWVF
jgi:hypothetical protein